MKLPKIFNIFIGLAFWVSGAIVHLLMPYANSFGMVFPGTDWVEMSPESQGVDSSKLNQALNYLESKTGLDGIREVVIIRNGYMIWKGDNIDKKHGVWSCTKIFTSAAMGLLVDDEMCVPATLAKDVVPSLSADYSDVNLAHFATMISGYDAVGGATWGNDLDGSYEPWIPTVPLFEPGEAYLYWDDAVNMMGYVLTQIAQEQISVLFRQRIADPIGMDSSYWSWGDYGTVDGYVLNGGGGNNDNGVEITAREMARFGHLFLNRGNWGGNQVISAAWVDEATQNHVSASIPLFRDIYTGPDELPPHGDIDYRGVYGYHWITNGINAAGSRHLPDAPLGVFYRTSYNDNFVVVVPEWDIVIVRLGLDETVDDAASLWNDVLKLIGQSFLDPTQPGCNLPNGHVDYCKICGPCGLGEGDCDGDTQCQAGLTCAQDVGADYGWKSTYDVCEQPAGPPSGPCDIFQPGADWCRDCGPCAEGQGDCDGDAECQSGLICAQDVGADYGWPKGRDVCEQPAGPPSGPCDIFQPGADWCRDCGPCAEGQGDCDGDAECQSGLICAQDVGADYGWPKGRDVCEQPAGPPSGPCDIFQPGADWCRDCGPCAEGQGDCDGDAECQSGLICAQDVGADYGWPKGRDVCEQPAGPPSGPCDIFQPGADWCRDCGPCAEGQGDCDGDAECQSGLICAQDVGADYGWPKGRDVCEQPAGPPSGPCDIFQPGADWCRDCGPCAEGQGDCDGDAECQSGLICAQDVGADYGWPKGRDVCEQPAGPPSGPCDIFQPGADWCRDCGPCAEGQGDCDGDAECQSGLICAQDVGADYGWPKGRDVCEQPAGP